MRKTLEQAGRFSRQRLSEAYHRILDADVSIKTGQYDPELALTILVAEVAKNSIPLSKTA